LFRPTPNQTEDAECKISGSSFQCLSFAGSPDLASPGPRKSSLIGYSVLFFLIIIPGLNEVWAQDRPADVAGEFYDQNPTSLKQKINGFLAAAKEPTKPTNSLVALIVPHAGYDFSGPTAAVAYQLLQGESFDTIILIGPQHRKYVSGAAVWPAGQWHTPLGGVEVDKDFVQALIVAEPRIVANQELHRGEHSLEVQLPFLQVVRPNARIVPILITEHDFAQPLAAALIKTMQAFPTKRFLVIASSDMTHYRPEELTRAHDQKTLALIKDLDSCGLERAFSAGESELCGAAAILTVLALLQATPQAMVTPLAYATSGDVSDDKTRVVGYGATMAEAGGWQEAYTQETLVLTLFQKRQLLLIARETLKAYINEGKTLDFSMAEPVLQVPMAVFVTLTDTQGKLRGCIGDIFPQEPLYLAVQHMTIAAAVKDSRFTPVRPDEVDNLVIEISILSYPRRVCNADAVRSGVDGVVLRRGNSQGVFLPDVWEMLPNRQDFFDELCTQKADLERKCEQDPQTQMDTFTSLHFDGNEFNG